MEDKEYISRIQIDNDIINIHDDETSELLHDTILQVNKNNQTITNRINDLNDRVSSLEDNPGEGTGGGGNADWNAEEGEDGFIKNKPIVDADIYELIYQCTTNSVGGANSIAMASDKNQIINLVLGEKYKVVINQETYVVICRPNIEGSNPLKVLSNAESFQGGNPIAGDFTVYEQNDGVYFGIKTDKIPSVQNPLELSIKVYRFLETKKLLDTEYLPIVQETGNSETSIMSQKAVTDAIANAALGDIDLSSLDLNSDWNAFEGQNGYIKNKPFGDVAGEYILNEKNLTLNNSGANGYYTTPVTPTEPYIAGRRYIVTIEDKTYDVICQLLNNIPTLTDGSGSTYSNPIFPTDGTFTLYPNVFGMFRRQGDTISNVSVQKIEYNKIDEKYLPDLPIVQTTGKAMDKVMSQKAVTEYIENLVFEGGGEINPDDIQAFPNSNQILYKTIDHQAISIKHESVESNVYYDNKDIGIITFYEPIVDLEFLLNYSTLRQVVLPNNVKHLLNNCFSGCSHLESVNIPSNLEYIPGYCFYSCYSLRTIYGISTSSISLIGRYAFANTYNIQNIVLPSNCKIIDEYAFYYSGINDIDFTSVTTVNQYAFCSTQLISIDTKNIKSIGAYVFSYCHKLLNVFLRFSLETLGNSSFSDCRSLLNVTFNTQNLTTIPDYCFSGCDSLQEISIPAGITYIGNNNFISSSKMTRIFVYSSNLNTASSCFNLESCEYLYWASPILSSSFGGTYYNIKEIRLQSPILVSNNFLNSTFSSSLVITVPNDLVDEYKETYPTNAHRFRGITQKPETINYWVGSKQAFEEIEEYDNNTIYMIEEEL